MNAGGMNIDEIGRRAAADLRTHINRTVDVEEALEAVRSGERAVRPLDVEMRARPRRSWPIALAVAAAVALVAGATALLLRDGEDRLPIGPAVTTAPGTPTTTAVGSSTTTTAVGSSTSTAPAVPAALPEWTGEYVDASGPAWVDGPTRRCVTITLTEAGRSAQYCTATDDRLGLVLIDGSLFTVDARPDVVASDHDSTWRAVGPVFVRQQRLADEGLGCSLEGALTALSIDGVAIVEPSSSCDISTVQLNAVLPGSGGEMVDVTMTLTGQGSYAITSTSPAPLAGGQAVRYDDASGQLRVVDAAGKTVRVLHDYGPVPATAPTEGPGPQGLYGDPVLSADGRYVYWEEGPEPAVGVLRRIATDGSMKEPQTVGFGGSPVLSPSGGRVAVTQAGTGVGVYDIASGSMRGADGPADTFVVGPLRWTDDRTIEAHADGGPVTFTVAF